MEAVVNEYISRELLQDPSLLPLRNETPLIETGILDSLSQLRLVIFIQKQFDIVVDDADIIPENFNTVDSICAYLRARAAGQGAQAGNRG